MDKLCQLPTDMSKKLIAMDLSYEINYTIMESGGAAMNEFEHDVQSKRNDLIDSGIGFIVAFVAFSAIFVVATVIDFIAS
jgi:hypothetical protein